MGCVSQNTYLLHLTYLLVLMDHHGIILDLLYKEPTSEVKPSMEQSAQRELQEGHKTEPLWIQEFI